MSGTSLDGIDASIIRSDGEKFIEIKESIVIGQAWDNDVRIILFVILNSGFDLTNDLIYSPDVSIYFWIIPMYLFKNIIKSR